MLGKYIDDTLLPANQELSASAAAMARRLHVSGLAAIRAAPVMRGPMALGKEGEINLN